MNKPLTKKQRNSESHAKCIAKALKTGYADFAANELPQQLQALLRELDSMGPTSEPVFFARHST
jgi:hypothetical protein